MVNNMLKAEMFIEYKCHFGNIVTESSKYCVCISWWMCGGCIL